MKRISIVFLICFSAVIHVTMAQTTTLNGRVYGTADVEGIHVINKTSRSATTTDLQGAFSVQAKENDTLVFSAVQYKLESILVDKEMIETKLVKIFLLENINQLDEVVLGKVLTGDLLSDIENSGAKPDINFYDVGIPGYKGKIKTQNERQLIEADHGKFVVFYGVGFVINVNKILNRISGRTKDLKQRVKLEERDELMFHIKAKYSKDLFAESPLEKPLHYEFFYFCSEDVLFTKKYIGTDDLMTMTFLQEKLVEFKKNIRGKN